MASIEFVVDVHLPHAAPEAWNRLVDWGSHGDWVPATRSQVLQGDGSEGTEFVAITGRFPLRLVDRMRVVQLDVPALTAEVEKLGPVLTGRAGFTVSGEGPNCTVHWFERVRVPLVPQFFAPLIELVSAAAFRHALRRMERLLP